MKVEIIENPKLKMIIFQCMQNMARWGYPVPKKLAFYLDIRKDDLTLGSCREDNIILLHKNLLRIIASNEDLVYETVYHELAHAVAGLDVGHGEKWQAITRMINQKTGLKIREKTPVELIPDAYWGKEGYPHG